MAILLLVYSITRFAPEGYLFFQKNAAEVWGVPVPEGNLPRFVREKVTNLAVTGRRQNFQDGDFGDKYAGRRDRAGQGAAWRGCRPPGVQDCLAGMQAGRSAGTFSRFAKSAFLARGPVFQPNKQEKAAYAART